MLSRIQASFELARGTARITFHDRSQGKTCQVAATETSKAFPFEEPRLRRVVVESGLNDVICMGGRSCDQIIFKLIWNGDEDTVTECIKSWPGNNQAVSTRQAVTEDDEEETDLPGGPLTRIHVPKAIQSFRYIIKARLGEGAFGTVYKALNVDTAALVAVKIIEPKQNNIPRWKFDTKREVETIFNVKHVRELSFMITTPTDPVQHRIVEFIGYEKRRKPFAFKIFMSLKDGSLASLMLSRGSDHENFETAPFLKDMMLHMLEALAFLDARNIIHRDVKPHNILYTITPDGKHLFQLGDFRLSNHARRAKTYARTAVIRAPEIKKRGPQTSKMDVWSLFVTLLWATNEADFRSECTHLSRGALLQLILTTRIDGHKEMARVDAERRASAAQMLIKLGQAELLTNHARTVPPLDRSPSPPRSARRMLSPLEHIPETDDCTPGCSVGHYDYSGGA